LTGGENVKGVAIERGEKGETVKGKEHHQAFLKTKKGSKTKDRSALFTRELRPSYKKKA